MMDPGKGDTADTILETLWRDHRPFPPTPADHGQALPVGGDFDEAGDTRGDRDRDLRRDGPKQAPLSIGKRVQDRQPGHQEGGSR